MLRIATRKSALALWQAERIKSLLAEPAELVPMSTEGDRIPDRSLAEAGGKGLFVKELEQALFEGRADLAVHSAKDVPFALPERLSLCAFPAREDARDALVAPAAKTFARLPRGARVGTSSLRRAVQLRAERPDLEIVPLRGNVPTRVARSEGLDAVVLALAGLRRLGLADKATEILPVELSLPAAGQGALAVEVVLARLAGGCTLPIAAYAVQEGQLLWLRAVLGGPDGRGGVTVLRAEARGGNPDQLGRAVAEALLEKGGAPLLAAAKA